MTDLAARVRLPAGPSSVASPLAKATFRLVLIATALACMGGPQVVYAQQESGSPSWGDVGVSVSPLFKTSLDFKSCCNPLGGWVTWGTGMFRLQTDYVHNRRRYRDYTGYYEERQGQEIVVERDYLTTHGRWCMNQNSPAPIGRHPQGASSSLACRVGRVSRRPIPLRPQSRGPCCRR